MFRKSLSSHFFSVIASVYLLMSVTDAFAWTAVAAWGGRVAFYASNKATPEQAQAEALKGCQKIAMEECELLGNAVTNTATVIARNTAGQSELFLVSAPNPLEAAKDAMTSCKVHKGDCVIFLAFWDGGPTWWAIASAEDAWHIVMSFENEQDAKDAAIQGCEERVSKKGSCKVENAGSGRGYAAIAKGENMAGIGYGDTKVQAEKAALQDCGDKNCKVTWSELNQGFAPPPATMKQVEKMAAGGISRLRKLGLWAD